MNKPKLLRTVAAADKGRKLNNAKVSRFFPEVSGREIVLVIGITGPIGNLVRPFW